MVSVNSSSNAWNNWQTRNAPPPTETVTPPTTTVPDSGSGQTVPGEVSGVGSLVSITDAPPTPLIYSAPAPSQLGRIPAVTAGSLSNKLDQEGFFSASATADQISASAPQQLASATLPEVLTQAEVIARAAYSLVSEAGASNPAASIVEQFG